MSSVQYWRLASLAAVVGVLGAGEPCVPSANHLDANSHRFVSDCGPTDFCFLTNSTCLPKGCRVSEFPFGYGAEDIPPPLCDAGMFCPDEESWCEPLVPVGGSCQLNRDDECTLDPYAPPQSAPQSAICLQYTCHFANVTVGQPCLIDNTVYTGYLPDGTTSSDIVSRDNCSPGLYCSPAALLCAPQLPLAAPCASDPQCASRTCSAAGACAEPPETPVRVGAGACALVGLAVAAGMAGTVAALLRAHQKGSERRRAVLREYWSEQLAMRKSIMDMHKAAAGVYGAETWQDDPVKRRSNGS